MSLNNYPSVSNEILNQLEGVEEELTGTVKRLSTGMDQFVFFRKDLILDTTIGFQSKAILMYLLTRCGVAGWQIRINDIAECTNESRNSIVKCMRELRQNGFAFLKRMRNDKGQIRDEYVVSDVPVQKWIDGYEQYTNHRKETSKKAYETQKKKGSFKIKRTKKNNITLETNLNENTPPQAVPEETTPVPKAPTPKSQVPGTNVTKRSKDTTMLGDVLGVFKPATQPAKEDSFVIKAFNIYSFYMMQHYQQGTRSILRSEKHRQRFGELLQNIKEATAAKHDGEVDDDKVLLALCFFLAVIPEEYKKDINKFMPGLLNHDFLKIRAYSEKRKINYVKQGKVQLPSFMMPYWESLFKN